MLTPKQTMVAKISHFNRKKPEAGPCSFPAAEHNNSFAPETNCDSFEIATT